MENLERLEDIRNELGRQLAHLKRQAHTAQRYRELKEEQRARTAELLAIRLAAVDAERKLRNAAAATLEVSRTGH